MKNRYTNNFRRLLGLITIVALAPQACANIRGGLTGKVIDTSSNPLENAQVTIYDLRKEKTVYEINTASDGRYEYYEDNFVIFNGYCGPSLRITVSKSGYNTNQAEFKSLCQLKRHDPILGQ